MVKGRPSGKQDGLQLAPQAPGNAASLEAQGTAAIAKGDFPAAIAALAKLNATGPNAGGHRGTCRRGSGWKPARPGAAGGPEVGPTELYSPAMKRSSEAWLVLLTAAVAVLSSCGPGDSGTDASTGNATTGANPTDAAPTSGEEVTGGAAACGILDCTACEIGRAHV